MRICIDAGHGMGNRTAGVYDPGAVKLGVAEADVNLGFSKTLEAVLVERGHFVTMTRNNAETNLALWERGKQSAGHDCFISIHCNSFDGGAHGAETFYNESSSLAQAVQLAWVQATGFEDRGARFGPTLRVLKDSPAPACLLEMGFLSNTAERAQLADASNWPAWAEALADAIERWHDDRAKT